MSSLTQVTASIRNWLFPRPTPTGRYTVIKESQLRSYKPKVPPKEGDGLQINVGPGEFRFKYWNGRKWVA